MMNDGDSDKSNGEGGGSSQRRRSALPLQRQDGGRKFSVLDTPHDNIVRNKVKYEQSVQKLQEMQHRLERTAQDTSSSGGSQSQQCIEQLNLGMLTQQQQTATDIFQVLTSLQNTNTQNETTIHNLQQELLQLQLANNNERMLMSTQKHRQELQTKELEEELHNERRGFAKLTHKHNKEIGEWKHKFNKLGKRYKQLKGQQQQQLLVCECSEKEGEKEKVLLLLLLLEEWKQKAKDLDEKCHAMECELKEKDDFILILRLGGVQEQEKDYDEASSHIIHIHEHNQAAALTATIPAANKTTDGTTNSNSNSTGTSTTSGVSLDSTFTLEEDPMIDADGRNIRLHDNRDLQPWRSQHDDDAVKGDGDDDDDDEPTNNEDDDHDDVNYAFHDSKGNEMSNPDEIRARAMELLHRADRNEEERSHCTSSNNKDEDNYDDHHSSQSSSFASSSLASSFYHQKQGSASSLHIPRTIGLTTTPTPVNNRHYHRMEVDQLEMFNQKLLEKIDELQLADDHQNENGGEADNNNAMHNNRDKPLSWPNNHNTATQQSSSQTGRRSDISNKAAAMPMASEMMEPTTTDTSTKTELDNDDNHPLAIAIEDLQIENEELYASMEEAIHLANSMNHKMETFAKAHKDSIQQYEQKLIELKDQLDSAKEDKKELSTALDALIEEVEVLRAIISEGTDEVQAVEEYYEKELRDLGLEKEGAYRTCEVLQREIDVLHRALELEGGEHDVRLHDDDDADGDDSDGSSSYTSSNYDGSTDEDALANLTKKTDKQCYPSDDVTDPEEECMELDEEDDESSYRRPSSAKEWLTAKDHQFDTQEAANAVLEPRNIIDDRDPQKAAVQSEITKNHNTEKQTGLSCGTSQPNVTDGNGKCSQSQGYSVMNDSVISQFSYPTGNEKSKNCIMAMDNMMTVADEAAGDSEAASSISVTRMQKREKKKKERVWFADELDDKEEVFIDGYYLD